MLDVLVIAPHPDDAELGMAGTIIKMGQDGLRVGILDLTDGEPTPHGSLEIRQAETAAATRILGIPWRENLGLPNRSLEHTLETRRKLAEVFRQTRPRWLFAPYWIDAHPDHVAATEMIEAARFWSKLSRSDLRGTPHHPERIFHYFCIHLRLAVPPTFLVDITPFWDAKRRSIAAYESQFVTGRPSDSPTLLDRMRDQAAYFGGLIGTSYAEPFAAREPLGVRSLRDFV
jgi:bacillithiol biosynthesis deacetylase BshB1